MKPTAYVIGYPIDHSKSPELFKNFFNQYNLDADYQKAPMSEEEIATFCQKVRTNPAIRGFNVTIPHKIRVMEHLDNIDELATEIGAVNAVVNKNGRLFGTNTDYIGIKTSIEPKIRNRRKAVVLGAGGAARAAVKVLVDLGFENVCILNRTLERAECLAEQFGVSYGIKDEKLEDIIDADFIINTTNQSFDDIDLSHCQSTAVVADLTYFYDGQNIVSAAKDCGLITVSGLEIFIRQAIPCAKMWFGLDVEYRYNWLD